MNSTVVSRWKTITLALLLAAGIFLFDIQTPLGVAEWVLYLLPIFVIATWLKRKEIYVMATICTVLIVLGFYLSPPGIAEMFAVFNRTLQVAVLWLVAFLLDQRRELEAQLRAQQAALAAQVQARTAELAHELAAGKQTEAELHALAEHYRMLADNVRDVIWALNEEGQFVYISPSVERLSGYPAETMMQRSVAEILTPTSAQLLGEAVAHARATALATGQPFEFERLELEQIRRDGATIWVELSGNAMYDAAGAFAGIVGITRDISERKRMEQELREMNAALEERVAARTTDLHQAITELERANAGKDAFIAAVSHELRTPLTGILGMADALQMQAGGPLTERQSRYVQGIRRGGERLLEMVNSILRYTSLVGGQVKLHQEACRLVDLCAISIANVNQAAAQKEQQVEMRVEPPDLEIRSDADAIVQVLNALLKNAVKFTPQQGQVGVQVAPAAGDKVCLVVWDTGIGIAAEQLPYLFKPFTQLDQRLARQYEGVGLGLAFVKQMVELLGGTVGVESNVGQGSRFVVTLPRGAPA